MLCSRCRPALHQKLKKLKLLSNTLSEHDFRAKRQVFGLKAGQIWVKNYLFCQFGQIWILFDLENTKPMISRCSQTQFGLNLLLDMITNVAETTDLYTATEAMLNFPIRPCQTANAHSLQLGISQLPVHLHTGLKRCTTQTLRLQNYKN